jgi:hypothetical protein
MTPFSGGPLFDVEVSGGLPLFFVIQADLAASLFPLLGVTRRAHARCKGRIGSISPH